MPAPEAFTPTVTAVEAATAAAAPKRLYEPLHDNVVIKRDETTERQSAGGIIIVEDDAGAFASGVVLAVGPGEILYNGAVRPLAVAPGDHVQFNWGEAAKLGSTADAVYICSERSILAKIHLAEPAGALPTPLPEDVL